MFAKDKQSHIEIFRRISTRARKADLFILYLFTFSDASETP